MTGQHRTGQYGTKQHMTGQHMKENLMTAGDGTHRRSGQDERTGQDKMKEKNCGKGKMALSESYCSV